MIGASLLEKACMKFSATGARFILKAVVEERLSAAGLFGREEQFHAQALQEMGHVLERGSVELVAQAGDEKLGFWHSISLRLKHEGHKVH